MLPGGFGTLDELSECLTLVQTGTSASDTHHPGRPAFWGGLLDWFEDKLLGEGMIGEKDLQLMRVIDDPDAVVDAIFQYYETRGFQASREEREKILNL